MRLYTDGLTIETSLDTRIQACADSAIKQFLPDLEKKIHKRIIEKREFLPWLNPEPETEEEIKAVLADSVFMDSLLTARATLQTALVALNPTNGQILAMAEVWIQKDSTGPFRPSVNRDPLLNRLPIPRLSIMDTRLQRN